VLQATEDGAGETLRLSTTISRTTTALAFGAHIRLWLWLMSPPVPSSSAATDPYIGRRLCGRYDVVKKLNQGGSGAVYLATQQPLDRPVALKVLLPNHKSDKTAQQRFEQEAMAIARLLQGNVVTLYDFGQTEDGEWFIAMEYLVGQSLREHLDTTGPFSWERAVDIGAGIADALGAAHRGGIVHRDLKPENVMLIEQNGRKDVPKVLDFGLARLIATESRHITAQDVIPGTPAYMSPERLYGVSDDPRSDFYALGAVLFELLTGQPPFHGDTSIRVVLRHIHEPVRAPSVVLPSAGIPAAIDQFVMRLLEKDPEQRPKTADIVGQTLRALSRPTGWHVATGRGWSTLARQEDVSGFAHAAGERSREWGETADIESMLTVVPGSQPVEDLPVALVQRKTPAVPVLLTRRKTISTIPALVSTAPTDKAGLIAAIGHSKSRRDVGELAVAYLTRTFERAFVVDASTTHAAVLHSNFAPTVQQEVLASLLSSKTLMRAAGGQDAYYGPPLLPDDVESDVADADATRRFFRALSPVPGAMFLGGLTRQGTTPFIFYADQRDPVLKSDARDSVSLLRAAAKAFSRLLVA
jgi:predicted Ser/Thr protein kinase